MTDADWYEVVHEDSLRQGDILVGCPVVCVPELPWPTPEGFSPPVDVIVHNLVILTQSCDLEHEKHASVLCARLLAWSAVLESEPPKSVLRATDFRKSLVAGNVPWLALLHRRSAEPQLPWSVVNFRELFTLPTVFVKTFVKSLKQRLRLRSPYREHLAQAFARAFMRVGLPHDAKAFLAEGKA